VIYFLIIAVLIIKTPLRSFMPGYTSANELRKQVISQAVLLDSLQEQAKINDQYLAMLQKVVTGDIAVGDSTASLKDVVKMDMSKVQNEPSDRENQFCSQYEIAQRYATNSQISETSKNRLMHRPALGVVLMGFDPYSGVNGVTLSVDPLESVYSALDGSVIFAGYSAHNRYCLQIQHSESLVSMYKFTQPFLKRIGERVHAGEILATLRGGDPSEMTFELWLNGQPLDPNDYIFNGKELVSSNNGSKKSNDEIATEVIRGDWGNGQERKDRLSSAGYDYSAIQSIVNARLSNNNTSTPSKRYYKVVKGDSLWAIAKKYYGSRHLYPKIAKANNIANPDIISIGQKLLIP
jgi:LysM repeat protein